MRTPSAKAITALQILILSSVIIAVYIPGFNVPFMLDDNHVILENPDVRGIRPISHIWRTQPARPLVYLSFALDFRFFGYSPQGYHLQNLLAHLIASIMLYLLLLALLKDPDGSDRRKSWFALAGALIFGIAPINTEAVTYLSGRFTVFAGMFMIFSVFAFTRFQGSGRRWLWLSLSALAFMLSFLCKEDGFILPLLILLFLWSKPRTRRKNEWLSLVPFAVVLAIGLIFRYFSLQRLGNIALPHEHGEYLATEAVVFFKYLLRFIFPVHLSYMPHIEPVNLISLKFFAAAALIILILLSGLPERWRSLRSFGILWIFIALAPSSSLVPLKDFMAEHRFYTASAGAVIVLVALVSTLTDNTSRRKMMTWFVCGIITAITLAALTLHRNYFYADEVRLLRDAVSHSPKSANLLSELGYTCYERGDYHGAVRHIESALANEPDNFRALNHMGLVQVELGQYDRALKSFRRASEETANPGKVFANIGMVYLKQGEPEKAMPWLREAARTEPYLGEVHFNLGLALAEMKQYQDAIAEIRLGIRISIPKPEMYFELGRIYIGIGRINEARVSFINALKLNPNFAPARMFLEQIRLIEQSRTAAENPKE